MIGLDSYGPDTDPVTLKAILVQMRREQAALEIAEPNPEAVGLLDEQLDQVDSWIRYGRNQ